MYKRGIRTNVWKPNSSHGDRVNVYKQTGLKQIVLIFVDVFNELIGHILRLLPSLNQKTIS